MAKSRASRELARQVSPAVMSQSELAEHLGVTPQAVSSWARGRTVPESETMAALEKLLGIPMRDWFSENEEPSSEDVEVKPERAPERRW